MPSDATVDGAAAEWDYRFVDSQFFEEGRAASIPCQLQFVEDTDQDTERFHDALDERGFSTLDAEPDRTTSGARPYYDGEICSQAHYRRIHVLVFRGDVVRLFPHDEYVPRRAELAALLDALEVGFDAALEHDPINNAE